MAFCPQKADVSFLTWVRKERPTPTGKILERFRGTTTLHRPESGISHQTSCIADVYIMAHNSSKIAIMTQHQNNSVVEFSNTGNCIKGHSIRKVESHWYRWRRWTEQQWEFVAVCFLSVDGMWPAHPSLFPAMEYCSFELTAFVMVF